MKYYIAKNGQPFGPLTVDQLASNGVTPQTLVWNESMSGWKPAGLVPELEAYILGGAQAPTSVPNGGYSSCQQTPPFPQSNYAYGSQRPTKEPMAPCPKTWLAESILVTLFCCLPFGIVGIIKASQVSSSYNAGDFYSAEKSSKDAGKWVKIGFFCGLAGILLYVLLVVILGASSVGALSQFN